MNTPRYRNGMPPPIFDCRPQFGGAVRDIRIEIGWTQRRLARSARLSLTYIGEIERGERMPSLMTIQRIASAVGMKGATLLAKAKL